MQLIYTIQIISTMIYNRITYWIFNFLWDSLLKSHQINFQKLHALFLGTKPWRKDLLSFSGYHLVLSFEQNDVILNKDVPPCHHDSTQNYKPWHSSLTSDHRFASGTFLQIDCHCISFWISDIKHAAETTNTSGSRVPQNTLHLGQNRHAQ